LNQNKQKFTEKTTKSSKKISKIRRVWGREEKMMKRPRKKVERSR
jgi:hypothetical protein